MLLTVWLFIAAGPPSIPLEIASPDDVVRGYINDLITDNGKSADSLWLTSEVARARRLRVTYTGIRAKYDCDSPVIGALGGLRAGAVQFEVLPAQTVADTASVIVRLRTDLDSLDAPYHLVKSAGQWRIVSQLWLSTQGWQEIETRYTTVHFHDSSLINTRALDQLDRFIDSLTTVFHMPDSLHELLVSQKIEYYLCNEDAMEQISGYPVHGMTSTPFDAVVSRHLPHYHELVHAVANVAMRELPLHQLPCLQEGLAVHLGGRWEKSPAVLLQLGEVMQRQQMGSIEEILTYGGFHYEMGSLDISYALSGLMAAFLIEESGIERYQELLRLFAGTDSEVRSLPRVQIENRMAAFFRTTWDTIEKKIADYAARYRSSGLQPGVRIEESANSVTLDSDSLAVEVGEDNSFLYFEIESMCDRPHGLILIAPPAEESLDGYRSRLFAKQAPGETYDGALYGIEFNTEEAGLYVYDTDVLLAKYVSSFDFSPGYWDADSRTLQFGLDKSLLPLGIDESSWRLVQLQP